MYLNSIFSVRLEHRKLYRILLYPICSYTLVCDAVGDVIAYILCWAVQHSTAKEYIYIISLPAKQELGSSQHYTDKLIDRSSSLLYSTYSSPTYSSDRYRKEKGVCVCLVLYSYIFLLENIFFLPLIYITHHFGLFSLLCIFISLFIFFPLFFLLLLLLLAGV